MNSFQLAVENNCKSITFPFISFESIDISEIKLYKKVLFDDGTFNLGKI